MSATEWSHTTQETERQFPIKSFVPTWECIFTDNTAPLTTLSPVHHIHQTTLTGQAIFIHNQVCEHLSNPPPVT
jgi:hypothetical protein